MRGRGSVIALLLLTAWLVPAMGAAEDGAPLRKVVVKLPFEEAELILKSEAQRQNFNLVNVLDIKKGMENRGRTIRPYKIYQFCNLELGMRVLADWPDYGAFPLCSVVVYEMDDGQTALVAVRQSWALNNLADHRPGPAALAAARQLERIVDEIFDAAVEEGKARGR